MTMTESKPAAADAIGDRERERLLNLHSNDDLHRLISSLHGGAGDTSAVERLPNIGRERRADHPSLFDATLAYGLSPIASVFTVSSSRPWRPSPRSRC
jgi:hypothetical protein